MELKLSVLNISDRMAEVEHGRRIVEGGRRGREEKSEDDWTGEEKK